MDNLLDPTKKIIFAEYLVSRDDPEPFLVGVHRHVLEASKEVLMVLTNLGEKEIDSPQVVKRVLNKFDEKEPKQFFKFYLDLKKKDTINKVTATNALNKVKEFMKWVEEHKK